MKYFFFLILISLSFPAYGSEVVEERRELLPKGAVFSKKRVVLSEGRKVVLHLFFFNEKHYALDILDEGGITEPQRYGSLKKALQSHGGIAGVNGGFFQPTGEPLGLTISQGKSMGKWSKSRLLSGVVYTRKGKIVLERRGKFKNQKRIQAFLQSGPFLIERGKVIKGLSEKKSRRRSFIGNIVQGQWVIGCSSWVSLAELAIVLAEPSVLGQKPLGSILNLDGGSSTCFWVGKPFAKKIEELGSIKTLSKVRNYVGVSIK